MVHHMVVDFHTLLMIAEHSSSRCYPTGYGECRNESVTPNCWTEVYLMRSSSVWASCWIRQQTASSSDAATTAHVLFSHLSHTWVGLLLESRQLGIVQAAAAVECFLNSFLHHIHSLSCVCVFVSSQETLLPAWMAALWRAFDTKRLFSLSGAAETQSGKTKLCVFWEVMKCCLSASVT